MKTLEEELRELKKAGKEFGRTLLGELNKEMLRLRKVVDLPLTIFMVFLIGMLAGIVFGKLIDVIQALGKAIR